MASISQSEKRDVSVYVRVRPLTPAEEEEEGETYLEGLNINNGSGRECTILQSASGNVVGFDGLLGIKENNIGVFNTCFADKLDAVTRGGTASLFCYGYTGGGKTHTTIGYGDEKGLFFLGAKKLLRQLSEINNTNDSQDGDDMLFLRATVCEMYLDKVYDILGEEKLLCKVRVDGSGKLVVGAIEKEDIGYNNGIANEADSDDETLEKFDFDHATIKTRVGLRACGIHKPEDLQSLNNSWVAQRATGISTTHHQSSRSHAILSLEIVTEKSKCIREEIESITAEIPPLKNAMNNMDNQKLFINVDTSVGSQGYGRVLRSENVLPPPGGNPALPPECEGDLWIKFENEDRQFTLLYQATANGKVNIKDGNTPRTAAEWSKYLGIDNLKPAYAVKSKNMSSDEIQSKVGKIDKKLAKLRRILESKQSNLDRLTSNLSILESTANPALGGRMILVDLAGADYDHRDGNVQKESAAINKSLLALKEVFRSLSRSSTKRPNFRNSKLTRILEDSIYPTESSRRKSKESSCVMLVNVSPASSLARRTINALRYGQIYASSSNRKKKIDIIRESKTANLKPWKSKGAKVGRPFARPANPEVLQELRAIYSEHVPGKTTEEVEAIIKTFSGREGLLLAKARKKYLPSDGDTKSDNVILVGNKK